MENAIIESAVRDFPCVTDPRSKSTELKGKGTVEGYKKERIKTLERFSGGALEVAVTASSSSKRSPRRVIGR